MAFATLESVDVADDAVAAAADTAAADTAVVVRIVGICVVGNRPHSAKKVNWRRHVTHVR